MQAKKRNFAYLRLSLEDGDVATGATEESQSIISQRMCIRQYWEQHVELPSSLEELVDDGYSGTHFQRPGIQKLLRLVELDQVDTIIVRDLSRFARNYLEAGHYLEFVFPAHGVRFISINDGYDSAAYNDVSSGLHIAIKNLINQMYSADISRKIKSAVDQKKLSGEYVYGTAPYGYKKGPKKNTIVIDEPAAIVVRRIFSLACGGKTITEICCILNDEGVVTPSVYLASVRGKYKTRNYWTYDSVRNILVNRIYTGDTIPFKSHVVRIGSDRVKQLSEAEQIVIPATHEAIVTREDFFSARLVIKSNVKSAPRRKPSVLTSYLVCGCCGNRLKKGKPQNKTFLCATARYVPGSDCSKIRCDEDRIKEVLLKSIRQQCMLLDEQIKKINAEASSQREEIEMVQSDLRRYKRRIESVCNAKMRLYEDYIEAKCSKEEYVTQKAQLNEQEEATAATVAALEKRFVLLNGAADAIESVQEDETLVSKYIHISKLDENLMNELIKKIVVYPDGSISIAWNFRAPSEEYGFSKVANQ